MANYNESQMYGIKKAIKQQARENVSFNSAIRAVNHLES